MKKRNLPPPVTIKIPERMTFMRAAIFFFILLNSISLFSREEYSPGTDFELASRIRGLLIANYDKKKYDSVVEKIILDLGKKTYIKMLDLWIRNFDDIDDVKFEVDPVLNHTISVIRNSEGEYCSEYFISLIKEMMSLSLKNFKMYFDAVKENGKSIGINDLNCDLIDNCMYNMKYFNIQKSLYGRETEIRSELKSIMSDKKVKDRIVFEYYCFELLSKIRQKTIDRHLKHFLEKIDDNMSMNHGDNLEFLIQH
jgi:hypothetical protein